MYSPYCLGWRELSKRPQAHSQLFSACYLKIKWRVNEKTFTQIKSRHNNITNCTTLNVGRHCKLYFYQGVLSPRNCWPASLASPLTSSIIPPTCFRIPDVDGWVQGTASQHPGVFISATITPPTCFCIPDVDGRVQGTASQHLGISIQRYNHQTHLFPYSEVDGRVQGTASQHPGISSQH